MNFIFWGTSFSAERNNRTKKLYWRKLLNAGRAQRKDLPLSLWNAESERFLSQTGYIKTKMENVENRKYSTCPGNEFLTKKSLHRSTSPFVASSYLGQEYKSENWDIKHRIIWAELLPFFMFMKKNFDEVPSYVCKGSRPVETTKRKKSKSFLLCI